MQLRRASVVAIVGAFIACTTYGETDKPIELPDDERDASQDASVDSNRDDVASNTVDASPDGSGNVDAVAPPPCTKTPNGGSCSSNSTCCSDKCNEARVCDSECRATGSSCDPFAAAPCCFGAYCNSSSCFPCIGSGATPTDKITGGPNPKSCCSRVINGVTGKCN